MARLSNAALDRRLAAQGVVSLIQDTVARFVSEAPARVRVRHEALRASHTRLVATMQGAPKAAVAVGSDGSIGLQLVPIVAQVTPQRPVVTVPARAEETAVEEDADEAVLADADRRG